MGLKALCPVCGAWIEGLLDYENHRRAHEFDPAEASEPTITHARARSRAHKEVNDATD